jgi:hypothetical protein
VARAALLRATFGRTLLRLGLTGEKVVDGTIGAGELLPGLTVGAAAPSAEPLPPSPVLRPGSGGGSGRVTLSAAQLRTNQRIAQQAVLRTGWLVDRIEGGLRGMDFRSGGLRADDLRGGG